MRDAAFSRQRYWGEPFPIIWKDGIAYPLEEEALPLELPFVNNYQPGPNGEGPLANVKEWTSPPAPLHRVERGAIKVPEYTVSTPLQYEFAKERRKNHTEAERQLWEEIRNNKLGVKFRREHPIEMYIADFICLQEALIIEVDGGYHETEEQKIYDAARTKRLENIGFKIIRFTNDTVLQEIEKVIVQIKKIIADNKTAAPLSTFGGEGLGVRVRETNTMPGYAGSSWYFLRYMDPHNNSSFCDKGIANYWNQVDVYVGGTEHAVGHLLYSRMWTKVLFDLGYLTFDEPFKKLVNQGMIQGSSRFVYRVETTGINTQTAGPLFVSHNHYQQLINSNKIEILNYLQQYIPNFCTTPIENNHYDIKLLPLHVDVNIVNGVSLNIPAFRQWKPDYKTAVFIGEDGTVGNPSMHPNAEQPQAVNYVCGVEIEKMSKSKFNTVNPNHLVATYGADTFRMYEMFLGPVEQSKPWDTKGIEGVHRFLKKLWRLFYEEAKGQLWHSATPTPAECKVLHKAIKKIEEDTERFSFNTAVSAFMIAVNELADLKCHKQAILEPLLVLLTPYAPHICEELWHLMGHTSSILEASYPTFESKYLIESSKEYPVSINGKTRTNITFSLDISEQEVHQTLLSNEVVLKWTEGKQPKKIIYVKGKMINVVV
jgi:leucyl-tRNA synthetase